MASPLRRRLPDRLSMLVLTGAYAEKPRGRLAPGFRKNNLGLNWNFSGFIRLGSSKRASNSLRPGLNGVDCVVAVFLAAIFPLFPFSLAKWGTGVGRSRMPLFLPGLRRSSMPTCASPRSGRLPRFCQPSAKPVFAWAWGFSVLRRRMSLALAFGLRCDQIRCLPNC